MINRSQVIYLFEKGIAHQNVYEYSWEKCVEAMFFVLILAFLFRYYKRQKKVAFKHILLKNRFNA